MAVYCIILKQQHGSVSGCFWLQVTRHLFEGGLNDEGNDCLCKRLKGTEGDFSRVTVIPTCCLSRASYAVSKVQGNENAGLLF